MHKYFKLISKVLELITVCDHTFHNNTFFASNCTNNVTSTARLEPISLSLCGTIYEVWGVFYAKDGFKV